VIVVANRVNGSGIIKSRAAIIAGVNISALHVNRFVRERLKLKAIKSDDAIIIAQFIIKAEIPDANVKRYAIATGSSAFAAEFDDRLDSRLACQFRGDFNSRSFRPSSLRLHLLDDKEK